MLTIVIPETELFDEKLQEFIAIKETKLQLEHSLISVSKWESKWHKAFLSKKPKTDEETLDYIRCMTMTPNVDPIVYHAISAANVKAVVDYIDDPMTATVFNDVQQKNTSCKDTVTSELIYYWMISQNVPLKCEQWHLNRLLTLIKVCGIKNTPPKKMSKRDIMSKNRALNAARRKSLGSAG